MTNKEQNYTAGGCSECSERNANKFELCIEILGFRDQFRALRGGLFAAEYRALCEKHRGVLEKFMGAFGLEEYEYDCMAMGYSAAQFMLHAGFFRYGRDEIEQKWGRLGCHPELMDLLKRGKISSQMVCCDQWRAIQEIVDKEIEKENKREDERFYLEERLAFCSGSRLISMMV